MLPVAASLVFLLALASSAILGANSPPPRTPVPPLPPPSSSSSSSRSPASKRVTMESLSEALEEIVAEVEAETEEVHDIIEKLDEELQDIFPHVHAELADFEEAYGKRPQYDGPMKQFAKIGVESIVDNLLDHLPREHRHHHHRPQGGIGKDKSVMPRQRKQQHLDLGDILGHKRKAGHREDGGAPKVTAEKMGRFVEAMSDLVKDVGMAYNQTPEGVEYDEAGLAASAAPAVAAAQRRFDDFPEAEAEAEFYDVLSGLEDAEDEILVAIAQGRADHIEEPKLAPPKEWSESESEMMKKIKEEELRRRKAAAAQAVSSGGYDAEGGAKDISEDDIVEPHPRMEHEIPKAKDFSKMLNIFTVMGAFMVVVVLIMALVAFSLDKFGTRHNYRYVRVRQHAH